MKKLLKRGLSLVLTLIMVVSLLPVTAFAAVDSTGRPDGLNYKLVLSIYKGDDFPGEPAVYGTTSYQNINSSFKARTGTFASTAKDHLKWEEIDKDLLQGQTNGSTKVWGVFDVSGLNHYFDDDSTILAREADIIRAMKSDMVGKSDAEVLKQYEVVWYVIKFQHRTGFFGASEWHIDGVIKEREKFTINYYGNGNTGGSAPTGVIDHPSNEDYVVQGPGDMTRKINGVSVNFLGWSARADGSGAELNFYQEGDTISADDLSKKYGGKLSLYAIWDTTTQHTATVNTYLDGVLTDDNDIHNTSGDLYLGTDGHYHKLTRSEEGVYTAQIAGNGKFHLFRESGGTYTQIGTHQLTIYNQNASLDIHHYSVTYDTDGGAFETAPGAQTFMYGESVTAITETPAKNGYRFLGWEDNNGNLIDPGKAVTSSITAPITLTAKWEQTVTVTVNVTIDHTEDAGGYDKVDERTDVILSLVSKTDADAPYLETGDTLELSNRENDNKETVTVTEYTHTFDNMPASAGYTVVTSKSGYDVKKVEATKDANGNWNIDVVMKYTPTNFDLSFTVEVDEAFTDNEYYPDAAIVKVTFWSDDQKWEIITQQNGNQPGVRVDLEDGHGVGSYPVWKYESNTNAPYGYRVVVTSFIYPDGTIVPVNDEKQIVTWTDDVYTATISDVPDGKQYGSFDGAYYSDSTEKQAGTLKLVINRNKYDVTFDAQGGTIDGSASQKVEDQYVIPDVKNYVPTRVGDYLFAGWYEDEACTIPATAGETLSADVKLYAKWIALRTIQGEICILDTYTLAGKEVDVNEIDKATEAIVVLEEKQNENYYQVNSQRVTLTYEEGEEHGEGSYSFSGILDDGKEYRIRLLLLNYTTEYKNEANTDGEYHADKEFTAVFGDDNVAEVNAKLTFIPPSYEQWMSVDATAIGEGFRPKSVLAKVLYRDVGDNHPYNVISQHRDDPLLGVNIDLQEGIGSGKESIWKWHTNGTLYDYQMYITQVDGTDYNSNNEPFYVEYDEPAYWNSNTETPSGVLKATLFPNEYPILFDLNAGTDNVTGMDAYKKTENDEDGVVKTTYVYNEHHKWSYPTTFTLAPQREGYHFIGWETTVPDVSVTNKSNVTISANVQQEVVLKALWQEITYQITANAEHGGTAEGTNTYHKGESATVTATAEPNFTFDGWYDGEDKVSGDLAYTFTVTADRTLTAKFVKNGYTVTATPTQGGTTTGSGYYEVGETATVTATPEEGFKFQGWFEGDTKVSDETSYRFTVENNRTLSAKFIEVYSITVIVEPHEGGNVTGAGQYEPMQDASLTASENAGYYFVGWYNEDNTFITSDKTYSVNVGDENKVFIAKFAEKVYYHSGDVYLFGYTDEEIGANGPLLRGELAQMIYRLVIQKYPGTSYGDHVFADTEGEWFRTGISYMAEKGAIDTRNDSAFPYAAVKRGETYKMICLGLNFTSDTTLDWSDYAKILKNSGYISGDGAVTQTLTRGEFCELFNIITGRSNAPLKDANGIAITAETYGYQDLTEGDPYYDVMLRATSIYSNGFAYVDLEKRFNTDRNDLDDYYE